MAKKSQPQDPHAAREAANYDAPIASRELILSELTEAGVPKLREEIALALQVEGEDAEEALRRRLRAMERDGQLMRNRNGAYCLMDKLSLIRGRVQGHKDGFGFLIREDSKDATGKRDDLFLHGRQMALVFSGDEVLVRESGVDQRGRPEGKIVEVLHRNTETLVGRYYANSQGGYVVPDSKRICHDVQIVASELEAEDGQFVIVGITQQPEKHKLPAGTIVEVLGDHLAPGLETDIAIRSHDIPFEWDDEVMVEANALGEEVDDKDKLNRIDIRHLPLVTIDGEDARDFDDAVYCEKQKDGGWKLLVAIADVSHYVQVNSALDSEAWRRGTSVYFPARVVPMLPEAISNGLCSLKPAVDRLCMVCEMTISNNGQVEGYQFFEAVMKSHARMTYTEVGILLDDADSPRKPKLTEQYQSVLPHVKALHGLYTALRAKREIRGALDINTVETQMLFDSFGKIQRIVPRERNDAHKLIEECMLAANVCAAEFLQAEKLEGLYRVHEGPKEEKLKNLRTYLSELMMSLGGGDKPSPADYQAILSSVADRPDASVIQSMLLRSMNQAVYQAENKGHFGLSYNSYAHFTSPIRRYPDLLMHRALRSVIRSSKNSPRVKRDSGAKPIALDKIYPYKTADLAAAGEHCSMAERRADEASRDVEAWLKCEYLKERVGEEFDGVIAAVTSFGLFVELSDVYVEGLIHVTALANDYYQFDQASQRLVGEKTKTTYQLGDKLTVLIARVDLDDRKIDLELAGEGAREAIAKTVKFGAKKKAKSGAKGPRGKGGPGKSKSGAGPNKAGAKPKGEAKPAKKPRKRKPKK
jgi:ribonuclease R